MSTLPKPLRADHPIPSNQERFMFFAGATVPGDATVPNEDWIAATPDHVVMLDGAMVHTETGCRHGAVWYVQRLGAAVIAGAASGSTPLPAVLAEAIGQVAALHPECGLTPPETPSARIAIVRIEDTVLRYLVLGDVTVVLDTTTGLKVVSDQRASRIAATERHEANRHLIGSPGKEGALLALKHAELAARNRPDGYWIAAADPSAVDFAITGAVAVNTVHRFAVLTDGAARAVDLFNLYESWRPALDAVESLGANRFIRCIREMEVSDPRGVSHPRNKVSDDATVVLVQVRPRRTPDDESRPHLSPEERIGLANEFLSRTLNAPGVYGDGTRQRAEAERAAERAFGASRDLSVPGASGATDDTLGSRVAKSCEVKGSSAALENKHKMILE